MSSVGEPSASLSSLLGRHSEQVVVVVLHCCRLLLIRPGPLACAMLDVLFGRLPTNTQFELLVIPPQKYLLLVKLGKWSGPANDFQLSLPATFTAAAVPAHNFRLVHFCCFHNGHEERRPPP